MSMSKTELLKLQNGSDVRGIACEGIENEHVTLTSVPNRSCIRHLASEKEKYQAGRMYHRYRYRLQNHRS